MTIRETYDFLMRIREINQKICQLTMQHNEARSVLMLPGNFYDKLSVQVSKEDKLSSALASVYDLVERIKQLKYQKAVLIIEIGAALDMLQDELESMVLAAYYIGGMSMSKVSEGLEFSIQHVYRLRNNGVNHLSAILSKT